MKRSQTHRLCVIWFYLHGMPRKASLEREKVDEWLLGAQNTNGNEGSFGSDGNVPKLDYSDACTTVYIY